MGQKLSHTNGIFHQLICSHTHQQNGQVAIKHKHLLQITKGILFQSSFLCRFWDEAILHTTHIINRLPSLILG